MIELVKKADENDEALAARIRRAMAYYKLEAMEFKKEGNKEGFERYRHSWGVLEAILPVDPSEYW